MKSLEKKICFKCYLYEDNYQKKNSKRIARHLTRARMKKITDKGELK